MLRLLSIPILWTFRRKSCFWSVSKIGVFFRSNWKKITFCVWIPSLCNGALVAHLPTKVRDTSSGLSSGVSVLPVRTLWLRMIARIAYIRLCLTYIATGLSQFDFVAALHKLKLLTLSICDRCIKCIMILTYPNLCNYMNSYGTI